MLAHLLDLLGIEEEAVLVFGDEFDSSLIFSFILNGYAQVHFIDFRFICSLTEMLYTCIGTPLDGTFSFFMGVSDRKQSALAPKRIAIGLKIAGGL